MGNVFFINSFINECLRDEYVNMHQFASLAEAHTIIELWRMNHNYYHSHRALGHLTPSNFVGQCQASRLPKILFVMVKDCLVAGPTSWLRSFYEMYNPSLPLQVDLHLVRDFPDVRLIVRGPDRGDVSFRATKKLTMKLGVADRLTLMGPVTNDKIQQLFHERDIF